MELRSSVDGFGDPEAFWNELFGSDSVASHHESRERAAASPSRDEEPETLFASDLEETDDARSEVPMLDDDAEPFLTEASDCAPSGCAPPPPSPQQSCRPSADEMQRRDEELAAMQMDIDRREPPKKDVYVAYHIDKRSFTGPWVQEAFTKARASVRQARVAQKRTSRREGKKQPDGANPRPHTLCQCPDCPHCKCADCEGPLCRPRVWVCFNRKVCGRTTLAAIPDHAGAWMTDDAEFALKSRPPRATPARGAPDGDGESIQDAFHKALAAGKKRKDSKTLTTRACPKPRLRYAAPGQAEYLHQPCEASRGAPFVQ